MEVITQQAVAQQFPAEAFASFEQALLKGLLRPVCVEDPAAVISAVDHMEQPFASLNAQRSRHGNRSDS